jgi:hypothetical protein
MLPVLLLPGLGATKLRAQVNCPLLLRSHPEIFKACKWESCESRTHSPKPEYDIWLPDINSDVSFSNFWTIKPSQANLCYGLMTQVLYNLSQRGNLTNEFTSPLGLNVTWYGNTPQTRDNTCGFSAAENLIPLPIQVGETKLYKPLREYFQTLGYQPGLTLQVVPFDFRMPTQINEASYSLVRSIRYLYGLTGKKVVIAAHSQGNLNVMHHL